MDTPLVSVLIPSFNHEKYIRDTIQSVLSQTYQNFEIIITDDGSNDNSVDVIKSFHDQRIKLNEFPQNRGASIAYKNCLERARGTYLACLSSDDIWAPTKLEKQVAFLERNSDYEVVFTTAEIIDEEGALLTNENHFYYSVFEKQNRSRHQWLNHFFFEGNCLCHPSVLARRGLYDKFQIEEMRLRQLPDFNVWIKICLEKEIYIIQEKLIKFRVRANELNASGNTSLNHSICSFEMLMLLENYLKLNTTAEVSRVLPNTSQMATLRSEIDNAHFLIGLAALNHPTSKAHRFFGAKILYSLFLEYGASCDYKIGPLSLAELQVKMGEADCFNIIQSSYFEKDISQYRVENKILSERLNVLEKRWAYFKRLPLVGMAFSIYSKLKIKVPK